MTIDVVEQSWDDVTIFIEDNLKRITPFVPECSIHRVPKQLLNMNHDAYVPTQISIGPFHHDEKKFKTTEVLKLRFFNSYRCRVGLSVRDIVKHVRSWEKTARQYYSETTNMDSQEFVKMMVLDGCFIVEFMIMNCPNLFPESENKVHSSFYETIYLNICVELIMLENQLPFCVLQNLFDLIPSKSNHTSINKIEVFRSVVHLFLSRCVLPIRIQLYDNMLNQTPHHLLEFLSSYFVPKDEINVEHQQNYLPPSATQLKESGIIFKKAEGNEICIMDISFKGGILNIPLLVIDDKFETCARNLLAFAQFSREENVNMRRNVTYYFIFLHKLITTENDVNLLVKEGIIRNCIGSEKEISQLFNDICKNIIVRGINCFSNVAKDLNQHCERRQNRWMASLRHNYFHTPWALISFLAATLLILLTVLQTIFSGISTFK